MSSAEPIPFDLPSEPFPLADKFLTASVEYMAYTRAFLDVRARMPRRVEAEEVAHREIARRYAEVLRLAQQVLREATT